MSASEPIDRYFQSLLQGKRRVCRETAHALMSSTRHPARLYEQFLWPVMVKLDRLTREDRINIATEHAATRIHRMVADQAQRYLPVAPPNGKSILITCAADEPEELGAQMCADLFESRGWGVHFVGGGVPRDELVALIGTLRPTILMIYGTQPSGVPEARRLVDQIREINANPGMNIMVSGGVYNRAEGLWNEVGADLFTEDVTGAIHTAEEATPRKTEVKSSSGVPKKRRRRKPAKALQTAEA